MSEKSNCVKCGRPGLERPGRCEACKAERRAVIRNVLATAGTIVVTVAGVLLGRKK